MDALPTSLPNELWGEVLEHIPGDVLPDITLTCHAFRNLGLPRLFQKFAFNPYAVDLGMLSRSHTVPQTRYMPNIETIENAMKRLEFHASPSIAPHVCRCDIKPWDIRDIGQRGAFEASDSDLLLNAFFQLLPNFSNVRHLECHAVNFNSFALSQLALLPEIRELHLNNCNVFTTSPLPTVGARTVHFYYAGRPEVLSLCGADTWLRILNPNRLEDIKVWPNQGAAAFIGDVTTLSSFPATQSLSLALPHSLIPSLPIILQHLPSLRRLHISQFGSHDSRQSQISADRIPHSTPPPLWHYEGPYELLHLMVAPGILSLSVDSFGSDGCDPDVLSGQLISYKHSLKNIRFFRARLLNLKPSFFADVCSLFVDLKAIYIESAYGNDTFTPIGFLDDLPLDKLPVGIEHVIMDWSAQNYDEAESKSESFKDRLLTQFPSIKSIWLSDWKHMAFFWKREVSGEDVIKRYPIDSEVARYTVVFARRDFYPEKYFLEL